MKNRGKMARIYWFGSNRSSVRSALLFAVCRSSVFFITIEMLTCRRNTRSSSSSRGKIVALFTKQEMAHLLLLLLQNVLIVEGPQFIELCIGGIDFALVCAQILATVLDQIEQIIGRVIGCAHAVMD